MVERDTTLSQEEYAFHRDKVRQAIIDVPTTCSGLYNFGLTFQTSSSKRLYHHERSPGCFGSISCKRSILAFTYVPTVSLGKCAFAFMGENYPYHKKLYEWFINSPQYGDYIVTDSLDMLLERGLEFDMSYPWFVVWPAMLAGRHLFEYGEMKNHISFSQNDKITCRESLLETLFNAGLDEAYIFYCLFGMNKMFNPTQIGHGCSFNQYSSLKRFVNNNKNFKEFTSTYAVTNYVKEGCPYPEYEIWKVDTDLKEDFNNLVKDKFDKSRSLKSCINNLITLYENKECWW